MFELSVPFLSIVSKGNRITFALKKYHETYQIVI